MVAGSRSRNFARAALNVAVEMDAAAILVDRFVALAGLFRSNREFRQLLITTRVAPDRKIAALRRVLGDQLGDLEYELLRTLLEQGLGGELPEVAKALNLLARKIDTGARLTVYSPQPMAEKELADLSGRLERELGRHVRATAVTQPALLGGLKLRLDNLLVDGSIQSRLERVRRELI